MQPVVLAFLLCDGVFEDPNTGKYTIIGTFDGIGARAFPLVYKHITAFVCLTNVHGTVKLRIRNVYIDAEAAEDVEVGSVVGELKAGSPLDVAESAVDLVNVMFPKPGQYRFQLYCEDELLIERKFAVVERSPGKPPEKDV